MPAPTNRSDSVFEEFPDVVTVPELQEMIGICRTKAYELISSGAIMSFRVGRSIRIPKKFIIEYLFNNRYNCTEAVRTHHKGGMI